MVEVMEEEEEEVVVEVMEEEEEVEVAEVVGEATCSASAASAPRGRHGQ